MIFYIFKSILISKNLAACFNLVSSPSYEDFLKGASIKVTLYGFRVIEKNFFVAKSTILKWSHINYYIF